MNLFTSLFLTAFISAHSEAAELGTSNSNIQEIKTKITCSNDMIEKIKYNSEEPQEVITKGLFSESLRTTWSDGKSEYRMSDFRSINKAGETFSKGRSITYFSSTQEGSRVTESSRMHSVVKYRDDLQVIGGNLQEFKTESTSVYLNLSSNERILISSTEDGKSVPTRDLREITTQLSDNKKSVLFVEATPYTYEPNEDYVIEVLKSEMTCVFETIK